MSVSIDFTDVTLVSEDTYGDDEYDEDDVLALMSTGHFCLQSSMYNVYNVQYLQGIIVYNVQCTYCVLDRIFNCCYVFCTSLYFLVLLLFSQQ